MLRYTAFAIGLALLVIGSYTIPQPDWDITISVIMAILTLLTAEYWLKTVMTLKWKTMPLAFFLAWFSLDGSYWLYWSFMDPAALELRAVAFPVNVLLYIACAVIFSEARLLDNKIKAGLPVFSKEVK